MRHDLKDGCEAGDNLRTGDSSNDKETVGGGAARSSRNETGRISMGVKMTDNVKNKHIRGTLKVCENM